MKRAMKYRGLYGCVDFDPIEMALVGRLAGIKDIVPFHADAPTAIVREFKRAVDEYIRTCEDAGKNPERAYSGKLTIRIDPETHAQAARAAEMSGLSFAAWTEAVIRRAAADIHDDATPV